MRRETLFLRRVTQSRRSGFDAALKRFQRGRGVEFDRDHARPPRVRERADAFRLHFKTWMLRHFCGQHLFDQIQIGGRDIAKELQGQMHILRRHPSNEIIAKRFPQAGYRFLNCMLKRGWDFHRVNARRRLMLIYESFNARSTAFFKSVKPTGLVR